MTPEIEIVRKTYTDRSTAGELMLQGAFACYTLEPRQDQSQGKPYCIPPGTYPLALRWSPRFSRIMPHIDNVPGFEGILIHWGNFPCDTEGCILVGEMCTPNAVWSSMYCFRGLSEKLFEGEITIR